jgi:hypothetical protein
MTSQTFAIVDLRDGTRRDVEPFLLDNDAFPILENAYLFRGRIQRRSGFSRLGTGNSRLRWQITTTGASPVVVTLPNIPITSAISQFTIGNVTFTDSGAGGAPPSLLSTDAAYTATLDRTTGVLTITHPVIAATAVYYYPGLPAMGLRTREQSPINDELLMGFDTRFAYIYDNGTQDFVGANFFKTTAATYIWSGTNSDQFWTTNYYSVLWASNNNLGLNAYTISNGTNATPSVITIGVGHNLANGDIVMIANTQNSTTLNGRTFQVQNTNPGAGTFEINNTVAPGAAYNSGYVVVLNRQVNSIAGAIGGDGIKWYDGPGVGNGWVNFVAPLNAATPQRLLRGGLIIVSYKNRLVVLNTYESSGTSTSVNFAQRARWCQNGTPFFTEDNAATPVEYLLPTNINANFDSWFDGTVGKGGFIDAPTGEAIVSAEFIKDTLIVYFERSTWQLVYTGNETLPFIWQKINTELGTEATFSIVPFDRGVFGVGNYGIISTDSVNVVRIDEKIPDEVFQIQNINNAPKRISGVRDYNAQLVYWAYPIRSDEDNDDVSYELTYPNQVLVYNYMDGSWAEFDDCFTCFGYWQKVTDATWSSSTIPWSTAQFAWNSQVLQAKYPDVAAGNQRGFVFVYSQLQQIGQNVPSLEISNASGLTITCPDHNFVNGDYILITAMTGFTGWNNTVYIVANAAANTFDLTLPAGNTIPSATGYTGGGFITHVPKLTIMTKQFNPFYENGDSVRLSYLDIYMDRTSAGQITAETYVNSNDSTAINPLTVLTYPEPPVTFAATQSRIWHRVYANAFGSFFQNKFTLSDAQLRDINIASSDIKIHGLVYYTNAAGRISYDI